MRIKSAFTLIELLVTICIIVLLVSILLPMALGARQSAYRVRCMSNMRQITTAVLAYTIENDGQLPFCNWANSVDSTPYYGKGWLFVMPQFRVNFPPPSDLNGMWLSSSLGRPPDDGAKTGLLWPYLTSLDVYHCPIDDPNFRFGTEYMTSYLMNGAQCAYGANATTTPGFRLAKIRNQTDSVLFWEGLEQKYKGQQLTGAVWNDGSSYPSEEVLADRHVQGANVTCFDGHAEWWNQSTWSYWVNYPNFGRLWCDPMNVNGR